MFNIFFPALLGVIAAQASPGPNFLTVASMGLSQGRNHALLVSAGVATGVFTWTLAFAAGLSTVFDKFPNAAFVLRMVGGCYLLYIAGRAIYSAWKGGTSSLKQSSLQLTKAAAYRRGLFVVLTNPKAAMMWAAVSAYLLGSGLSMVTILLFSPAASMSAFFIYGAYGLLFSSHRIQEVYFGISRVFDVVFGARIAQEELGIPLITCHLEPVSIPSIVHPAKLDGLWMPHWINSPDKVIALFPDWFAEPQPDWPKNTEVTNFLFFDESGNSSRLREFGISDELRLKKHKSSTGAAKLRKLLEDKDVQTRCKKLANELKNIDPLPEVCRIIGNQMKTIKSLQNNS